MVFSAENNSGSSSETVAASPYGQYRVNIQLSPLVQSTTSKDEILISVNASIFNVLNTTLDSLLTSFRSEVISKVDTLLGNLNGSPNPSFSNIGYGHVTIGVKQFPLVAQTSNPSEIVFQITIGIFNVTRNRLDAVLDGLKDEIMEKVSDVL